MTKWQILSAIFNSEEDVMVRALMMMMMMMMMMTTEIETKTMIVII